MKRICILTATRSEYGLLKPVILKLRTLSEFDIRVAVTGAHLSPEFGLTYLEIEKDGIPIDGRIEMLLSADTPSSVTKSMGVALIGFADYFDRLRPDLLVVLGDRYETLAVCIAAMNQRIPVAHLYGGETTEGAVDESIRHAITKLSYLHFTSAEPYRQRVLRLGEHPDRVFCVGAVGIENALHQNLLRKSELEAELHFSLDVPYAVITFHPVTLEEHSAKEQTTELLEALRAFPDMKFIFTKANADADGRIINSSIDAFVAANQNAAVYTSLGSGLYLSALKYCHMVIGNSSSGLIEAPSFGIPSVNIGDRQKGRLQAAGTINCRPCRDDIEQAVRLALTPEFRELAAAAVNPYGDGNTSGKIVSVLREFLLEDRIHIKKSFYDGEVT